MNQSWQYVFDMMMLSLLIVVAAVLKARIPVLRKLIVPTAMIAGFLGLIAGPEMLGWIRFDPDTLGNIVYHLMAVGFIALSLKEREVNNSPGVVNSGIIIVSTYLIQGIVGFGLFLLLTGWFYKDMFPGIGLLLPLGFGQGPGQAYSIGSQWEALGLRGGGNLGLTIAGIGFLWATVIGIIFMNILARRRSYRQTSAADAARRNEPIVEKSEPDEIPLADAIDKLTYQIALIGFIYLLTYLTLYAVDKLLSPLGSFGQTFAQLLVGFHFLIGSIYAIAFRLILNRLQRAGFQLEHAPNNFLLQRIAGFAFDYMITASIAAISIYGAGGVRGSRHVVDDDRRVRDDLVFAVGRSAVVSRGQAAQCAGVLRHADRHDFHRIGAGEGGRSDVSVEHDGKSGRRQRERHRLRFPSPACAQHPGHRMGERPAGHVRVHDDGAGRLFCRAARPAAVPDAAALREAQILTASATRAPWHVLSLCGAQRPHCHGLFSLCGAQHPRLTYVLTLSGTERPLCRVLSLYGTQHLPCLRPYMVRHAASALPTSLHGPARTAYLLTST